MADRVPRGPWTLEFADGSGNLHRLARPHPAADIILDYTPVTPATSSSGLYSGGLPRHARLAADDPRLDELWCRSRELVDAAAPATPRAMGTTALTIATATGTVAGVVGRSPALDAIAELLASLGDARDLAAAAVRDAARAAQDVGLRFTAPTDAPAVLRPAVVALVREQVGWPALAISQDEALVVVDIAPAAPGWQAHFRYVLDRDFCSQYDRTERWSGTIAIDDAGHKLAGDLAADRGTSSA